MKFTLLIQLELEPFTRLYTTTPIFIWLENRIESDLPSKNFSCRTNLLAYRTASSKGKPTEGEEIGTEFQAGRKG